MKLQFLVITEEDSYEYFDLYLDEAHIIGFFVSLDADLYEENIIDLILSSGDRYTVILTDILKLFLNIKFDL